MLCLAMLLVSSQLVLAREAFPGAAPDRSLIKTQEKVDKLFEKGQYERAMFIFRHELAPLGDKYAQYMVGYMHLTGKGVPTDSAAAIAWYRLAAERGERSFVQAHDEIAPMLDDEQRVRSEQVYIELRVELSDANIVANLADKDIQVLRAQSKVNSLTRDLIGRDLYKRRQERTTNRQIANRLVDRMDYLNAKIATDESITALELKRIEELEEQVQQVLTAIGEVN